MMTASPCFVTHKEMNTLLGDRRRLRWENAGYLPSPDWIWVNRSRLALYPEVLLARVVVGPTHEPREAEAVRDLAQCAERLVGAKAYQLLRTSARDAFAAFLEERNEWNFPRFLELLAERDRDALDAWREDVAEAEESLSRKVGLSFRSINGRVLTVGPDGYLVSLEQGVKRRVSNAIAPLDPGTTIVLERVGVESREREFLLPAVAGAEYLGDAGELRHGEGVSEMEPTASQNMHSPFDHIVTRSPFSAMSLMNVPVGAPAYDAAAAFVSGHIPGLHDDDDAPDVKPARIHSLSLESSLLDTPVPA